MSKMTNQEKVLQQRRITLIPYCIYSFSSNLCSLLPVVSCAGSAPFVKECCLWDKIHRIAHSQGSGISSITLFHSYRDFKVAEQRVTFALLEVYKNIVIRPTGTAARTRDSSTKSATTKHTPSPLV